MFKEKLMVALGALCLALFTGAAFAQNADTRWQDQPRVAELLNEIVRTLPSGHSRLCRVAHGPIPPDTRQELFDNVVFEVLIADTNQSFEVKSRNITITDASFCTSDPRHCAQGGEWWIYYCASGEGLFMGTAGRNFLPHIITSIRQEATPFDATQLDAGRVNAQAIEIEAGELNTYQFRAIQVALGIDTAEFVRQGLGSSQGNEFEQRRVLERRLDTLRQGARQYSEAQSIDFVFRDVPVLVGPYDFSRGAFAISVPERLSVNTIAEDIPNSALTAILVWDGVWSGCNYNSANSRVACDQTRLPREISNSSNRLSHGWGLFLPMRGPDEAERLLEDSGGGLLMNVRCRIQSAGGYGAERINCLAYDIELWSYSGMKVVSVRNFGPRSGAQAEYQWVEP